MVNGRTWTQTIVMLVIFTFRKTKQTLQKLQNDIVWPNYQPNCQRNAIGPQSGFISSEWKPRYRQFGGDRHTYRESGVAVAKLRRICRFWFYLSLSQNAISSKHKLNNPHIHFHSLVHTLAGLNENQCPRLQFQDLFDFI